MKLFYIITATVLILTSNIFAQKSSGNFININVDTLLSRYHLLGVKIFIKKVGVLSLKDKTLSLKRSDFNDKLLITLYSSISLSENNYGAKFDYLIKERWILRGETYRRNWGQQSGISLLYRMEY